MAKPTRTFSAAPGQQSTGTRGPLQIMYDFDQIFAMFDPASYLPDGSPGGIREENIYTVESVSALPPNPSAGNRLVFVKDPDGDGSNKGTWYYYDGANWRATGTSVIDHTAALSRRALDVKDFGAKGDGTSDDYPAVMAAITAAQQTGVGVVYVPAGTYGLSDTLVIPQYIRFQGAHRFRSVFQLLPSAEANKNVIEVGDGNGNCDLTVIADIGVFDPHHKARAGFLLREARFCDLLRVFVQDCEIGIEINGEDTWAASNVLLHPHTLRCKTAILLTADAGKQTNACSIIAGQLIGGDPRSEYSYAIRIQQGDTNVVFGTDMEEFDTGIFFESTNPGGNRAIAPRLEGVDNPIVINSGSGNNQIIGGSWDSVSDNSGLTNNLIIGNGRVEFGAAEVYFGGLNVVRGAADRLDVWNGDIKWGQGYGPVLVDKSTGLWYRLEVDNGVLVATALV